FYRNFIVLQILPTVSLQVRDEFLLLRIGNLDGGQHVGADYVSRDRVLLAENDHIVYRSQFLDDALDLRRVNLLSADVDDFGFAPENPEILSIYFDSVSGVEPAVFGKLARRVQVAEYRRLRFDLQDAVHHSRQKALAADPDPQRVRGFGFGLKNADFGEAVSLLKSNLREEFVESAQGALGLRLGPFVLLHKGRGGGPLIVSPKKNEFKKRGRSQKLFDSMLPDRAQSFLGGALAEGSQETAVSERI